MGWRLTTAVALGAAVIALQFAAACVEDPCPPRDPFWLSSDISAGDVEYILAEGPQGHHNDYLWAEGIPCEDYCIHFGPRRAESYESWEFETCVFDIDGYELGTMMVDEDIVGSVECSGTWQPRCSDEP